MKLTSDHESLAIENFEELKAYTKVYWVKLLGATWVLDGEIISDELLKNKINNKSFDILEIKILEGYKITLSHNTSPLIILLSSNNCLNK